MEDLRQFINTVFPDEAPAERNARVPFHFEYDAVAGFIFLFQLLSPFVRVHIHGAEFIEIEVASVEPYPDLTVDQRSRRIQLDPDCRDQKYRRKADQQDEASDQIEASLQQIGASDGKVPDPDLEVDSLDILLMLRLKQEFHQFLRLTAQRLFFCFSGFHIIAPSTACRKWRRDKTSTLLRH